VKPAEKMTADTLLKLAAQLRAEGVQVHAVYEAGPTVFFTRRARSTCTTPHSPEPRLAITLIETSRATSSSPAPLSRRSSTRSRRPS
jgi:hypothetical protein